MSLFAQYDRTGVTPASSSDERRERYSRPATVNWANSPVAPSRVMESSFQVPCASVPKKAWTRNGFVVSMIREPGPYWCSDSAFTDTDPPSPAPTPFPSEATCTVDRNARVFASMMSISMQRTPQTLLASQ
eukprot:2722284-Prymnesium_polylepis.1